MQILPRNTRVLPLTLCAVASLVNDRPTSRAQTYGREYIRVRRTGHCDRDAGTVAHKTIHAEVDQGLAALALDAMRGTSGDAHQVARYHRKLPILIGSDVQAPGSADDVEQLFRVIVLVQRRRFARFQDHHKSFGGLRLGSIHHEVVGVGWEAVSNCV